jgi:voltage-gated sodium channel
MIKNFIESNKFKNFIISVIIINSITLGLETSQNILDNFGSIISVLDLLILIIFVIEIVLKLYIYKLSFFKSPWNIMDLLVVSLSLIPNNEYLSSLRTLRVLRVLRLITAFPAMKKVVEGLFTAIPGIISVASIISIFFYMFAVIGTHLYGGKFPEWFGDLPKTMFTLFQIMTLESWSMGIVRPVMNEFPSAWIFFVSYIICTTFTMLNLFIAVIVNAMHKDTDSNSDNNQKKILIELADIKSSLKKLK